MTNTKIAIRENALKATLSLLLLLTFCTPVSQIWAKELSLKRTCHEALLTVKPRIGLPSSKGDNFDIRIISSWRQDSQWSNSKLNNAALENVSSLRAELNRLGFLTKKYINVLVEKHVGAVGSLKSGIRTSIFIGPHPMVTIPRFFGGKSMFLGSSKKQDSFENIAPTLILAALTPNYHSVFSRFTIAHELAHASEPIYLSEPSDSSYQHYSLIWSEGRADFLAYAISGVSEILWPSGISSTIYSADGKRTQTTDAQGRSLRNP
ncbi:MAG: hypothetical protein KDD40_06415, partial [Bdellovibrionales bacterium]|nr:hypothetical protein [Bdellovibrionales bacterium]